MKASIGVACQRRRIVIQGVVQGVGFRPFVYKLAVSQGLVGFIQNDTNGVTIEVEGPAATLDRFARSLYGELPPLARIDTLTMGEISLRSEQQFTIVQSEVNTDEHRALIAPDTAICADCLSELLNPADRRYHYAFINCTNCGPRFTIIQDVPYDRARTTMRDFQMCPVCQQEYGDPLERRFHAQPNACPNCGPHLSFQSWAFSTAAPGALFDENEAIASAAQALASGSLLALKGLGGYHLACDALNEDAVLRLRQRKHREARPFALMIPDLATARQLCQISADEEKLLLSPSRPIVLLERHQKLPLASCVAPFSQTLGLMLPYTPLHYLLLQAYVLAAPERLPVLVMTSGNLSSEPIVYRDEEAQVRLRSVADGILTHDRAIHTRCDDSIVRHVAGDTQFFRRARGYVPEPLTLVQAFPEPVLACGGHLKNTFCLGRERQAFLSQHLGDLENLETLDAFRAGIVYLQRLFAITPTVLAYDLHPAYLATIYALESTVPMKIGVQHHHAHIASVLAEHGLSGPVIGVAADGTGYGTDGAIWGCEIMRADLLDFERVAHLAYVPLPGGEQAVRQPWRMAAVYLARAYGDDFWRLDLPLVPRLERSKWRILEGMIARGLNTPLTSSLGRLFDAVAALLGLRTEVVYEGQAAIELETFAEPDGQSYPFALRGEAPVLLDVLPMFRALVNDLLKGVALQRIAGRFHTTIAELLLAGCLRAREQSGLQTVALSGGVFQNRCLLEQVITRLQAAGFQVYTNRRVPPNDGGLSLGQAAIASARLQTRVIPA